MIQAGAAHVDEAGARLSDGHRLYVVAAVLSSPADHPRIIAPLIALQINPDIPLHFRTERSKRRLAVAQVIAEAPLHGAILLITSTGNARQEQARARLLCELLPRLERIEGVRHVVVESRAGGDRHDRRTRDRLRRSHHITAGLRVDHADKSTPMLWLADWVASAYVAAHHHDEREPWDVINSAHLVEITTVEPR